MKHILLLGALFLFGATASAQSCTGASGDKAKTECTKSKSSCSGKASAKSCCQGKSSAAGCCDSKSKKGKKAKAKKGTSKDRAQMASINREETKGTEKSSKKAGMSPAKN